MFYGLEFSYNGVSSAVYDLMIYDLGSTGQEDVSFGNKASIIETRTTGRIQPIHYGVNYHATPLEFSLVFGAAHYLDRYDLQAVAQYLTGSQEYGWLSIDQPDMENIYYHCIITELKPLSVGMVPVAFKATVKCDCPYAYSSEWTKTYKNIVGTESRPYKIIFDSKSTASEYLRPDLTWDQNAGGMSTFSIENVTDNYWRFVLADLNAVTTVHVDGTNGIITDADDGTNAVAGFNGQFFRLLPGKNELSIVGRGTLTMSGRFLYNVGA